MGNTSSDRVWFVQASKHEVFTIKQIQEKFGVAANTARSWTNLDSIVKLEGSYPFAYTHESNVHAKAPMMDKVDLSAYVKLHDIDGKYLDENIKNHLIPIDGAISKINVGDFIKSITTEKRMEEVEAQLVMIIQIARRYYETEVKDNG